MKSPETSALTEVDIYNAAFKFRNIIYSLDVLKNDEMNISKKSFPYYNEIDFNTDTSNQIADMLRNSKLFDILILDYINKKAKMGEGNVDIDFHPYQQLDSTSPILGDLSSYQETEIYQSLFPFNKEGTEFKTYDFDLFTKDVKDLNSTSALVTSAGQAQIRAISAAGEHFADADLEIFQSDPLTQLIYKMKFLSNYSAFVKNNLRNYKDISQGKSAYSETLFYRVEKRDENNIPIQNFYVLNDSDLNDVKIIDTQVRYGKEYRYRIFAIQYVLGNKYIYRPGPGLPQTENVLEYDDEGMNIGATQVETINNPYLIAGAEDLDNNLDKGQGFYTYNLIAETEQSAKLIEVPYVFEKRVRLQEAPPVPPDINIVPYRGVDNQVLITFNAGIGEYYDEYITLSEEDEDLIDASTIVNENNQVLFKSEGDVTGYEMFRISEMEMENGPASYHDFENSGKKVTLNRDFGEPTYIDNILPNRKYWYTFRTNDFKHIPTKIKNFGSFEVAIDETVNFSNPTEVYQIELINNEGAVYLIMNTYDISYFRQQETILKKVKSRTMRKYLHIKPSFEQTIINTSETQGGTNYDNPEIVKSTKDYVENVLNEDVTGLKLGYTAKSVFGNLNNDSTNKFKVRLTSKKTGRKIEVFLRFKKPILEK